MSGPDLALGVDTGTSGVRAAVIDLGGDAVETTSTSMSEFGADLRDPAIWRSAMTETLLRLGFRIDLARIGAVAVDGTSGTVLALDRADLPIGQALLYNDAVDDPSILAEIANHAPADSGAHGAASALARAMVLQTRPGVRRIVHQADWMAEQLADARLPSDESNALKTGYDPVARRWPDWLEATRLRRDLLPDVVPVGAVTGRISGAFGLPVGIPIVAGLSDGCASFLATGAALPGDGVTALGTTLTIKLLSKRPIFAPEYGIYSHRIGDMWLAGGASNTGGGVLAQHFTPARLADLSVAINPDVDSGLDYYPLPAPGERFPINDPTCSPRMTPRPDDDAAFLHGLLEGMARIEALGYVRLAERGAPRITSLRTVGGGARNPVWGAMRQRIVGAELVPVRDTSAAVGTARLALRRLVR